MNIQNINKDSIEIPAQPQLFSSMVDHQTELMIEYQAIENMPDWPMPFQSKQSQIWFKSFMWRAHEELCEAQEALYNAQDPISSPELYLQHINHFFEELSDALHFLIELMIIANVSTSTNILCSSIEQQIVTNNTGIKLGQLFLAQDPSLIRSNDFINKIDLINGCNRISYQLGLAGNILKFKSWKRTAVISDENNFHQSVIEIMETFFKMLYRCYFKPEDIYILYMSKKMVNTWRQETKY